MLFRQWRSQRRKQQDDSSEPTLDWLAGIDLVAERAKQLGPLAQRSREVLLLSAAVGAIAGLFVALFDLVTIDVILEPLLDLNPWLVAFMPMFGLVASRIILSTIGGGASPATSDEYLIAFNERRGRMPGGRALLARTLAAFATLGTGTPMGLEGPSIYLGGSVGSMVQRRLPRIFANTDPRVLLVAGAAGGVAAIFKAPATGAVFAIEFPYQDDFVRRMLLPSLVAASSGYLAFVWIHDTDALFPVQGSPLFDLRDIGGAVVLGLLAGLLARLGASVLRRAKTLAARPRPYLRAVLAGLTLAAIFQIGNFATEDGKVTFGPGYETVRWAIADERTIWLLVLILALRCVGTATAVAGGGVGGLFVPLVVAGALLGQAVASGLNVENKTLFLVVGIAAFLSAGYRVPLAAITFVAETTGRPGFIVPGLLASVAAELMMGEQSITPYQRAATYETQPQAPGEDFNSG